MTISLDILTGDSGDVIAPSPCTNDPVDADVSQCTVLTETHPEICDNVIQNLYASGLACPITGDPVYLYEEDFTGVSDGATPSDPPFHQYQVSDGFGNPPYPPVANTLAGFKVIQATLVGGGANRAAHVYYMFDNGYTGFDSTRCGVFTEAIFHARTTPSGTGGGISCGLVIGVADGTTTKKILWNFHESGSGNSRVMYIENYMTNNTAFFTSSAGAPVQGDKFRLELKPINAYLWKIEAFKNEVSVGSSVDQLMQLTHAKPKNIGMWFGGNESGFASGTHTASMRSWKGGVI